MTRFSLNCDDLGAAAAGSLKYPYATVNGTNITLQVTASGWSTADVVKASVRATNSVPPVAPTGLYAISTGSGKITLYWEEAPNATGYNIYRSTSAGNQNYETPVANTAGIVSYAGGSTLMWTDSSLSNGSEYFYTVKALTGCAEGEASNEDSDIVDPEAIPWDTRDPGQILNAAANALNASTPDGTPPIDIDDDFEVTGPDGANYRRGMSEQQPPTLLFDAQTGGYTLPDGTPFALSSDALDDSQQEQGSSANEGGIRPMEIGGNVLGGAYRGAITYPGYNFVSFRVQLGNVYVSPYGKTAHDDHPVVYLGSSAKDAQLRGAGVDAGLIFGASSDNRWHFYLKGFGARNAADYSAITFPQNGDISMFYFLERRGAGRSRRLLADLTVFDRLDGRTAHKAIPVSYHNFDFSNVKVKRNQQLAEFEKGANGKAVGGGGIRGVNIEKTGSYMTGFNWINGIVGKSTESAPRRWGIPDTSAIISWPGSSAASVTFNEATRVRDSFENGVSVDLR